VKFLAGVLRELGGLFVDDGMLALAIVGVIGLAAIVVRFVHDGTGGILLVVGVLFALFANLMAVRP
jgi:hypothetical protein